MAADDLTRIKHLHAMLAPERLTCIVDIGASPINPAPYDALLDAGLAHVIGFEPQPGPFAELQRNPIENRTILPYAVGDGQEATLHVCKASGFTSLLEPNTEFLDYAGRWQRMMRVVEKIPVQTKRLDDIAEIDDFDMLKIDIQGGEHSVYQNGLGKLRNALAVYTEVAFVPIYRDQPLLDAQMQTLRPLGFELHKLISLSQIMLHTAFSNRLKPRGHRHQLIDGDVVFIRNLLALGQFSVEQRKHLAILSDAVFGSYDLTLKLLEGFVADGKISKVDVADYIALLPNTVD